MARKLLQKNYYINPETLQMEVKEASRGAVLLWRFSLAAGSIVLSLLYFWFYTDVLGLELPKTVSLKKENAEWTSKMDLLTSQLAQYEELMVALEQRDEKIYRSIFGLSDIPELHFEQSGAGRAAEVEARLDRVAARVVSLSRSFDEVSGLSSDADKLASSIPAIMPVAPVKGNFRISSSFGSRIDPVYGTRRMHNGQDFALKIGTPVYVTGDGVVATVKMGNTGYGHEVVIDHGFGYKTRYAHLSTIHVSVGMTVSRGDCIALSGNTGKSTGPHLHYEVMYRNKYTNPVNYYDSSITLEEYSTLVREGDFSTQALTQPSISSLNRKK